MLALPAGVAAEGTSGTSLADPLVVWLKGPFGTVPGGSPDDPATAAPDGAALDAWSRSAALELGTELPAESLTVVDLSAQRADGGPVLPLERHEGWFAAPDDPGRYVITAQVRGHGREGSGNWLVDVPDREGGPAAIFEMPVAEAVLRSAAGETTGVRGHGCYVGLCQEVGLRPPPGSLEVLSIKVGETPELALVDGSAMVHWQGWLEPLAGTEATMRRASASFDDEPQAAPRLDGLQPTAAGEWLLEVRVDYDRDRGWQWFLYRLRAE